MVCEVNKEQPGMGKFMRKEFVSSPALAFTMVRMCPFLEASSSLTSLSSSLASP
jgi:hypothetical protein